MRGGGAGGPTHAHAHSRPSARPRVFAWGHVFAHVGQAAGVCIPGLMATMWTSDHRRVFSAFAGVGAVIMVALYQLLAWNTRYEEDVRKLVPYAGSLLEIPPPKTSAQTALPFIPGACVRVCVCARAHPPLPPGLRRSFRNRPFRSLVLIYSILSLSGVVSHGLTPFYLQYVLRPPNYELWLGAVITLKLVAGALATPLWAWVAEWGRRERESARRRGAQPRPWLASVDKRTAWLAGWVLAVPAQVAMVGCTPARACVRTRASVRACDTLTRMRSVRAGRGRHPVVRGAGDVGGAHVGRQHVPVPGHPHKRDRLRRAVHRNTEGSAGA